MSLSTSDTSSGDPKRPQLHESPVNAAQTLQPQPPNAAASIDYQLQPPDMVDTRDIRNKGFVKGDGEKAQFFAYPYIQDPHGWGSMSGFPKPGLRDLGVRGTGPPKKARTRSKQPKPTSPNSPPPPPPSQQPPPEARASGLGQLKMMSPKCGLRPLAPWQKSSCPVIEVAGFRV